MSGELKLDAMWAAGMWSYVMPQHAPAAVLREVDEELGRAIAKHPPMVNLHEAHSVIWEELVEYFECVRQQNEARDPAQIRHELVQVAAMAIRAIVDVVEKMGK